MGGCTSTQRIKYGGKIAESPRGLSSHQAKQSSLSHTAPASGVSSVGVGSGVGSSYPLYGSQLDRVGLQHSYHSNRIPFSNGISSTRVAIPPNRLTTPATPAKLVCDKCDGGHTTDSCPYYPKPRENHPDALRRKPPEMGRPCGDLVITKARVIRQPGDGSCLFHSLAYGLQGSSAGTLRRELATWVRNNPHILIADTPLKDWLWWDSRLSPANYASRIGITGWGGGIEMAACSRLKGVDVHVWEQNRTGPGFRRISCFDASPNAPSLRTINVIYQGGVHYDTLVPLSPSR